MKEWHEVIDKIRNHIVKITTPQGHGTGFLIAFDGSELVCIATAAHVVDYANYWQQPIRIHHPVSKKEIFLASENRAIDSDKNQDTASIFFAKGDLEFPNKPLPFIREGRRCKEGVDIGWVGFPAINPDSLCFFNGRISCWMKDEMYYLVDGVAIGGVSGGPAFTLSGDILGLVTNYIPTQIESVSTPGLCVIRDILHARKSAAQLKSVPEAREKIKTQEPPKLPISSGPPNN